MVTLDDLRSCLHDFVGDAGDKDPHMPSGLQVGGREEVELLATGVSASLRLFEEAVARQAKATSRAHWVAAGIETQRVAVVHRVCTGRTQGKRSSKIPLPRTARPRRSLTKPAARKRAAPQVDHHFAT